MSDFATKLASFKIELADKQAAISVLVAKIRERGVAPFGQSTILWLVVEELYMASKMVASVENVNNPYSDSIKSAMLDYWMQTLNL